jgi:hypothetical protein
MKRPTKLIFSALTVSIATAAFALPAAAQYGGTQYGNYDYFYGQGERAPGGGYYGGPRAGANQYPGTQYGNYDYYGPRGGSYSGPYEWYAGPGPVRRGGDCVVDTDLNRGYGYMKPCPAKK